MLATVFVSNVAGASVVIGICGVSWALTMWAPFSLLGEYIAEMEERRAGNGGGGEYQPANAEHRIGMNRIAMSSRVSLVAGQTGLGTEGGLYQLVEQFDNDGDSDNVPREANGGIELHEHHRRRRSPQQQQQEESPIIEATINNINDQRQQLVATTQTGDLSNTPAASSGAMMTALNDHGENGKDSSDFNGQSSESSDRDLLLGNNQQENNNDNHSGRQRSSLTGIPTTNIDANIPSAGVLLGIHNMYIVAPQFLVTFFSSVMFHFLEKNASEGEAASPDAIGVVLRFGALMAGVAAFLSSRIGRPYK